MANIRKSLKTLVLFVLAVAMIFTNMSIALPVVSAADDTSSETYVTEIKGANMTIGQDLSLNYYATLADEHKDATMHFVMSNGKEVDVKGVYDAKQGVYKFTLNAIPPQTMGDTIDATLKLGDEVLDEHTGYSVKAYAQSQFTKYPNDAELKQLLTDMLYYGEAAQLYRNYETDALVTNDVQGIGTPSDESILPTESGMLNQVDPNTTARFTSAGVWFDYNNRLYIKFNTTEGVTVKVNGETVTFDGAMYNTNGIYAVDFDKVYTFELYEGETLANRIEYSIKAYVYNTMNKKGEDGQLTNMAKLVRALYAYGKSAEAYRDAKPENVIVGDNSATTIVIPTLDNKVSSAVSMSTENGAITAYVPAGVALATDTDTLTLKVNDMADSKAEISLEKTESAFSINVHIDGISANNDVATKITIKELLPVGLNMGNYRFYHVENGETVEMILLADGATPVHNNFEYDPATGDVVLYLTSFSEIALVADDVNAWNGEYDYTWYDVDKKELTIANADQLAAFGAIVGGMAINIEQEDGTTKIIERDSFKDKTVKLLADINLGDAEKENNSNIIFYPIGYYNSTGSYDKISGNSVNSNVSSFEGIFDGNGNTISNFYQNTWEMFGDYNDGYTGTPNYYKDAMGLFGYVKGGTIKNLTVDNFSSDGEFTPTGVIAAYADGNSNFENIAITNCNPRVYNTGNGGIIGIAGSTSAANDDHIVLKNITVDNSNKISALWGSWDVACGGLVGMYRGNVDGDGNATDDTISFENCHVAAQIDVYNDVCANYQYYAYRYAGMIIGSVRHNTTNEEGKTIPNMTGISATGCTVNYGTWNDYYYCEFEKNSMASYSEDYQFSRVDKSEITFDENGKVTGCTHTHTEAEDKRAVYLPFHQLFTGYSWGVNSVGLKEYSGIVTDLDITEGDQQESVEKFEGKVIELSNSVYIKLGDIFSFVDNGVELVLSALTVTVTNLDENDPVSAEFNRDTENWENSTIKFTGTGKVEITIQDYYFCTPTTITVDIIEPKSVEKFGTKFVNHEKYLYRVGNASGSTVSLGTIFTALEGAEIDSANVKVEFTTIAGNAAGEFTSNATWTNGTIQFTGTGVVKVTISANGANDLVLNLEVVDATNLTSATGTTTGGNFVLLCDVNTSTYIHYKNCTLYGNGFTYSLKDAPTDYNSKQGHGILITENATLDNLVIVGDVYNSYGAYTNQDYYNAAIDVLGDTVIQNCYISGCSAPISTRANATIINTTLYGGTVGNLIIKSGTVTLEDVTTANYDDGRSLIGMGIVIHSDATESAKLVLNGTLTQYNFLYEENTPSDTYAKNLHTTMFGSSLSQYHFGTSPKRYVNTGVVSLTALFDGKDITDNANTGYVGSAVTLNSVDGYVYTQPNTSGSVNNSYNMKKDTHVATTQGTVPPSYSFDYTNKNYVAKTDGSNDYCYEENGKVNISMDVGDTFNWDTSILTIGKDITNYTVSMNGTDYTGKSIDFNTAGDYEVVYTYTDPNNYKLDENGNITTYSEIYTKTVNITVAVVEAATKHAEFTFGSSNTASTTVTIGNNTYVMPNVSATSSTIGSTTVSGQTIYYPIVEIVMSDGKTSHTSEWYAYFPVFSGAVTITDYKDNGLGDAETFGSSTQSMPSGLSIVGDPASLFKYQSSSTAGTSPVVKNNILVYSSPSISANRSEYNTVIQYSYQDNAGTTYYYYIGYHAPAQSYSNTCVTPDTLITLANGTQVRVDSLTGNEELLVWNMETGKLDTAPIMFVDSDPEAEYEIVHLYFSDGTDVKIIYEHGFWDYDLNKYVYLDANASAYIGHTFAKQNGDTLEKVQLVDVVIEKEMTTAWSPVTAHHLCYFVNGMLSMPGGVGGLFNIFDVDADTMTYDYEAMQKDIETYGLYTYEELNAICPLSEEMFNAAGGAYLKISIAKGNLTEDELITMINRYSKFFA